MENYQLDKNATLFIELVLSFSSLAMQQLGKTVNPTTSKIEKKFAQAQQTIDMLTMLKEKTKGNLSKSEMDMLTTSLSTLQLNYVDEIENESKEESGNKI